MVRLKREDNPIPGEKPGYLPQYIDEQGTPITVTPSTPYPTKDKELELVKVELQAIKNQLNGTLNTQVTGSLTGYADEPFPQGQEGFSLSVVDRNTNEVTFYKYVMGDWRLLG